MTGTEPPRDDFTDRLRKAQGERAAKAAKDKAPGPGIKANSAVGFGFRVGVDLTAALIVGVFLGWAVDRWGGTSPWGLVVGFMLGAAAGVMNVYRALRNMGYAVGYRDDRRDDKPGGSGTQD